MAIPGERTRFELPDKVPWHMHFSEPALAKLAVYFDDSRLADYDYFNLAPAHDVLADTPVENMAALTKAVQEQ